MNRPALFAALGALLLVSSPASAEVDEFEPYLQWNADAGLLADVDQDASTPDGRAGLLFDLGGHASGGTFLPKLTLGDDEKAFFGFTSLGASVDASFEGELEACEGCEGPGEIVSDVELGARILWVDLLYGETYQRPVTFDDGYWRPESGLAGRSLGLRFPGVFQLGTTQDPGVTEVAGRLLGGEVRRRELFDVDGLSWAADDGRVADEYEWSVYGGYMMFDGDFFFELDFVKYRFQQWITPTPIDSGSTLPYIRTYAPGAQFAGRMTADLIDLVIDYPGTGRFRVDFGVSSMAPIGLEDSGRTEDQHMQYKYALEYGRSLDVSPIAGRFGWNAGIRSFHRLDPTGMAVDAGSRYILTGSVRATDRLRFDVNGTLVYASRELVSPFAEPGQLSFSQGDRIVMGRATVEASWELNGWLSATAEIWGERSDRTDPLAFASEPGLTPLRGGWGGWLGLRANFGK